MKRALAGLLLSAVLAQPALAQPDAGIPRRAGIEASRAGDHARGIALMRDALRMAPEDVGIRADLVTLLMWAGRDRDALAEFARLGEGPATPGYAFAAAAVAARRSGDPAQAVRLYRAAMARGAEGADLALGLALAEAARGNAAAARQVLAEARARYPNARELGPQADRDIARNLPAGPDPAVVALDERRPFDALAILAARAPGGTADQRLRIIAIEQAGAPALALDEARRRPGVMNAAEMRRLESGANAFLVRWGGSVDPPLPPEDPAHRYANVDRALAALDAAIAAWATIPEAAAARRNARIDRLLSLRDRRRMTELLAEAAALEAEGPLPVWVRGAIGDAHSTLRMPVEAEADFRAVLAAEPDSTQATLGLFYALVDQRRWEEARVLVDRLEDRVPRFRPIRGEASVTPNWDSVDATTAAALWRLYADALGPAAERAESLAVAAPANTGLRGLRADIWRARGWAAAALEEAEAALSLSPFSLGLRMSRAEALMDLRMWREAEAAIAPLVANYGDSVAVQRLARRWQLHNMWELEAEARTGLERGNTEPEFGFGARIYSPPIGYDWRLFAGALVRAGDTPEGNETATRGVLGVEYRIPAVVVRGGAIYETGTVREPGAFIEGTIRLSDQWRLEAVGETLAVDTPLRALRNGITASGAGVALGWRAHESRDAAVQFRVLRFSDDNVRTIGAARWTERVVSAPDWRVDLTPYAYMTENSRPGGPYFAPERDLETGLTASVAWVAWRQWERDLVVAGAVTAGGYWQEDFGWSPVFAVRWENRHGLSDALALTYGAGWSRRDYDGKATDAFSGVVALRWRL